MQIDNEVDVFLAVKQVRAARPPIIQTIVSRGAWRAGGGSGAAGDGAGNVWLCQCSSSDSGCGGSDGDGNGCMLYLTNLDSFS